MQSLLQLKKFASANCRSDERSLDEEKGEEEKRGGQHVDADGRREGETGGGGVHVCEERRRRVMPESVHSCSRWQTVATVERCSRMAPAAAAKVTLSH